MDWAQILEKTCMYVHVPHRGTVNILIAAILLVRLEEETWEHSAPRDYCPSKFGVNEPKSYCPSMMLKKTANGKRKTSSLPQ
ncbi:hypothetical protein TNCV_2306361 [Trichonephila clavipes]|nr:hypothetical protein TNCV_2306361 [Trichonephila clavipes]